MKTTDLMVGDYIYTNSLVDSIQEVAEIYQKGVITKGGWSLLEDELRPILIAPDILKKSGWKWDKQYAYLLHDLNMEIVWYKHEGILRDYYQHKNGSKEMIYLSRPGLKYIHELQHAFRMLGIEKGIEL